MKLKTLIFTFIICCAYTHAQKLRKDKTYFISAIGFWNVENLYDTLNDVWKNDEEFTPSGKNAWTGARYRTKLEHLAEVISQMATDVTPDGLAVLGLCEIENKNVVEDLVKQEKLKKRNYKVVHIEGPDARGVDPSFIYNPTYFTFKNAVSYHVALPDTGYKTRDILVVSGLFNGEPMSFLINHWPSRRGGELRSRPGRINAAKTARRIADSILKIDPNTKIAIMGDLNDDPVNESVQKHVGTYDDLNQAVAGDYFNPMGKLYAKGVGSLAYKDAWNLFDQILLNKPFLGEYFSWNYYSVRVFNKPFMKQDYGNFKGGPFHTYSGGVYTGGYSDHFPVYIVIAKEKK